LLDSFLNFFSRSEINKNSEEFEENNEDIMIISGLLVEAAAIDGEIDEKEILKIKDSLIVFFKLSEEKSNNIVNKSLEKVDEQNSLHYFTSKINKEFKHDKKIILLEILWEIILSDGKIHDFESNLIRRLSGLLYISDIECGNAKKRASKRI